MVKIFKLFIPVALVALFLGGCGNTNIPTNNSNTPQPESNQPATSSSATFENTELGFSLSYPANCETTEGNELKNLDQGKKYTLQIRCADKKVFTIEYFSSDFAAGITEGCCFSYADEPIDTDTPADKLLARLKKLRPQNITKTEVGGKKAVKFFSRKEYTDSWWNETYILPAKEDPYTNTIISSPTLKRGETLEAPNLDLENNSSYQKFQNILKSINFKQK